MNDYIYGRPCSTSSKYGVKEDKEDDILSLFDPNEVDEDELQESVQ